MLDFCRFLGLMVSRVLLNNRIGQFKNNFDIFVSLFDVLNDKGILGIIDGEESSCLKEISSLTYTEPSLFKFTDDQVINYFHAGHYDELVSRQMIFWLVHTTYESIESKDIEK
jgi:hypothetical protein